MPFVRNLIVLFAAAFASALASAQGSLTGTWLNLRDKSDGTQYKTYFTLDQDGETVTGKMLLPWGDIGITGGTVHGGHVVFFTKAGEPMPRYEGEWTGDALTMMLTEDKKPPVQIVLRRLPPDVSPLPPRIEPPPLRDLPSTDLAQRPPMGWNAWNHFHDDLDDATVRQIADAMVASGMKDAGYLYVNIDDEWAGTRDAQGNMRPNRHFPNMKALAGYVHSKGLKLGLYSSPGPLTCESHDGSYGHEEQDARAYAAWGVDYLKYDWCSAFRIYKDGEMRAVYQKMGAALQATGRPIVYSLCQYGLADVWNWGPKVDGSLWRTTHDIGDNWKSMIYNAEAQLPIAKWAGPGHWNDPDMLEVGNGGMTAEEYRTQFTLWAMLSAPLLAGNDLRSMTPETLATLTNREVIAIDQDALGAPPARIVLKPETEAWIKPLSGGGSAVALLNRSEETREVQASWAELGLAAPKSVRDLWSHESVDPPAGGLKAALPAHGSALFRMSPRSVAR